MTLLITAAAAVIATALWYKNHPKSAEIKLGTLCWLYWGASLMWLVDAIAEYAELGAEYFAPAAEDMINDTFLGFSVVVLGMIIWIVVLLVSDPKGVIKSTLFQKKQNVR